MGQSVPVLVLFWGHDGMCATAESSRTLAEHGADFVLTSRRAVLFLRRSCRQELPWFKDTENSKVHFAWFISFRSSAQLYALL